MPTAWPDPYWKKGKTLQKKAKAKPKEDDAISAAEDKKASSGYEEKQIFPQTTEI